VYKTIVERRVRKTWRRVSEGDYGAALDQFAPRFDFSFAGEHALAGERHTRAELEPWFARVFEIFPGIRFDVRDVFVRGWPWHTRVVVLIDVRATVLGEPYRNEVVQELHLRWGRVTYDRVLEDTQKLARALELLGVEERDRIPLASN
jgi:ketosteroid isomerase-like protein